MPPDQPVWCIKNTSCFPCSGRYKYNYIRLAGETHAPSKGVIRTSYLTCAFVGDTMDDDSFGHVGNVQVKTVLKRTTMQCAGSISGARGRGQGGALVVNESTFEESASSTQTVADASRNTS